MLVGSLNFNPSNGGALEPFASPLFLVAMSIIWGVLFMILPALNYEYHLHHPHDPRSYTRFKYTRNQSLGFGALLCLLGTPSPLGRPPDRHRLRRLLRKKSAVWQLQRGDEVVQLGHRCDQPAGAGRRSVGATRAPKHLPEGGVFHRSPSRSHRGRSRTRPGYPDWPPPLPSAFLCCMVSVWHD